MAPGEPAGLGSEATACPLLGVLCELGGVAVFTGAGQQGRRTVVSSCGPLLSRELLPLADAAQRASELPLWHFWNVRLAQCCCSPSLARRPGNRKAGK